MKELANKFKGQFECFEENTDTYKTFSVSIEKEMRKVDKDGNEDSRTVIYKMKSIDSARFMASSLWNLVDNLAEAIHKIKCKICYCFFEYERVNDNLMKYKCLSCN